MSHTITIKVRGYHLDLYRHVNNARYLEFLEEARWSFLEMQGDLQHLEERGYGFAVVNINISYRRPAYMGEILEIRSSLKSIGTRSAVIYQAVMLQNTQTVVAEADVAFVIVELQTEKAAVLEGELRGILERMASMNCSGTP